MSTTIVDGPIRPCVFSTICFMKLRAPTFGAYVFIIVTFS
jgi:hypothetical protein